MNGNMASSADRLGVVSIPIVDLTVEPSAPSSIGAFNLGFSTPPTSPSTDTTAPQTTWTSSSMDRSLLEETRKLKTAGETLEIQRGDDDNDNDDCTDSTHAAGAASAAGASDTPAPTCETDKPDEPNEPDEPIHLTDYDFFMMDPIKRWSRFKSEARRRGIPFSIDGDDHFFLTHRPCIYCGVRGTIKLRIGLDRLDSAQGYTQRNCVPACHLCNSMKGGMAVRDFLGHIRRVLSHVEARKMPIESPIPWQWLRPEAEGSHVDGESA